MEFTVASWHSSNASLLDWDWVFWFSYGIFWSSWCQTLFPGLWTIWRQVTMLSPTPWTWTVVLNSEVGVHDGRKSRTVSIESSLSTLQLVHILLRLWHSSHFTANVWCSCQFLSFLISSRVFSWEVEQKCFRHISILTWMSINTIITLYLQDSAKG